MAGEGARAAAPARSNSAAGAPRPVLGVLDATALVVGIVVGAGIFRAPSTVASNAPSVAAAIGAWLLGGVVSLAGAMCYAELATAYPHAGGDYHFLHRALGRAPAFLFGWARLTVIPTGSVAMLGFVFGDYAAELLHRPGASPALAALMVSAVIVLNVTGLTVARRTQIALAAALVLALLVVSATGLLLPPAGAAPPPLPSRPVFGLAMVFVLLAYGGWNEAAYVSAELRGGRRVIATALVVSISLLTVLYVLANVAYLRGLGLGGVQRSSAVAAELLTRGLGPVGGSIIAGVVAAAAFSAANATMLMGSRMIWAFGLDLRLADSLGRWSGRAGSPVNAILLQGVIALALVALGSLSRSGFEAMVAYVAPVFWLFFLLTGLSLFVLRRRDPAAPRPFRVPLYPVTPLVFCAACAYLLWSSLVHAGPGALLGLAVLATGLVPLWLTTRSAASRRPATA